MKMTAEEERILKLIASTGDTPEECEGFEDNMPHYILYHKEKGHNLCYCTHCREYFQAYKSIHQDPYTAREFIIMEPKHKQYDYCPLCHYRIQFLADGRGRSTKSDSSNFAIVKAVSENELVVRCFRVTQRFLNPFAGQYFTEVESEIFERDSFEVARYYFKVGEQAYKFGIKPYYDKVGGEYYDWERIKTINHPVFNHNPYGIANNQYELLNLDEIQKTKFRYIDEAISQSRGSAPFNELFENSLKVYAEWCVHPQIEYLLKTGFENLVASRLRAEMCGIRLNWKSNNVKEVLRMTSEEMELLAGADTKDIATYYQWRKLDTKSKPAEMVALIKVVYASGHDMTNFVKDLIVNRNETCHSIVKYIGCPIPAAKGTGKAKPGKRGQHESFLFIKDWQDYLNQCRQLHYDLDEPSVFKPNKLDVAHERLTGILKVAAEVEDREAFRRTKKSRKFYSFTDEEHGLIVRVPQSIDEIINEGKELVHCVGGYAKRHAHGELSIVFVRKVNEPDKPFYTMEVSKFGIIVQCRGYRNNSAGNPKPQYIKDFEIKYQEYLDECYRQLAEKNKAKKKAKHKKIA